MAIFERDIRWPQNHNSMTCKALACINFYENNWLEENAPLRMFVNRDS